jgi:mannose-6-phosphate isomerase
VGLGFDLALEAVDRSARDVSALMSTESADAQRVRTPLPDDADQFFRADVLRPGRDEIVLAPAWTVLIVTDGAGRLEAQAQSEELHRGDVLLVPWGVGPVQLVGDVTVTRCRPPEPTAP